MFNLEEKISEWRSQMLAAGLESPVPLEELEVHLREEIETEAKSGISEAEAFNRAVQKLGHANPMRDEFKKIAPAKDTLNWKWMDLSFGLVASVFPLLVCSELLHFKTGSFVNLTPSQQISGLTAVAVFTLLMWSGRLGWRIFPAIPSKRNRSIITVFCFTPVTLWWVVFLNFIVPRYDFTMGQFGATFLWAFVTPAGLMLGLPWGIEAAARKKSRIPSPELKNSRV